MGEKIPTTTSFDGGEKTEQRGSKKTGRQSSSGQPQQRYERIETLEVTSIEKGPIGREDSQNSPQELGPEYRVKLGEPADSNGEQACTIPVPDVNKSRADSQLGRVLVANGHGQNEDAQKLIGERVRCGRVDGQWQVIDPDLDSDDPRFTEDQGERRRLMFELIINIAAIVIMLIVMIATIAAFGYAIYHMIFTDSTFVSEIAAGLNEPSPFGLPYGSLLFMVCMVLSAEIVRRHQ